MTGMHDMLTRLYGDGQTHKRAHQKAKTESYSHSKSGKCPQTNKHRHQSVHTNRKHTKTQRTFNAPQHPAVNFLQARKRADTKYNHTHTYTINTFRVPGLLYVFSVSQTAKHAYTQRTYCTSGEGWLDLQAKKKRKRK